MTVRDSALGFWLFLTVVALSGCGSILDRGEVEVVLDADDICRNTSLRISTEEGVEVWVTEDLRPAVWSGQVVGSFKWSGDEGTFVGPRGVELEYRLLGENEFSELRCSAG